ncbi:hypothetical protein [Methylomonas sp. UP202]|uniref:hypothetical protein n=1 Tax=Methylomonas sp. UP202 TaxID=3040943 RepID=UPI0024787AD6|nr:hypothetical protein [Methylomonas sp. UP202]WGS87881.1 hypothetical protein QC632_08995 [Methylomonas sp. UP202]
MYKFGSLGLTSLLFFSALQPAIAATTVNYDFSTNPFSFSGAVHSAVLGDYRLTSVGAPYNDVNNNTVPSNGLLAWGPIYRNIEPAGIDIFNSSSVGPYGVKTTLEITRTDGQLFSLNGFNLYEAGTTLDVINLDLVGTDSHGTENTSTVYYYGPGLNTFAPPFLGSAVQNVSKVAFDTSLWYRLTSLSLSSNVPTTVPIPGAIGFMFSGLLALGALSRKRSNMV